MLSAVELPVSTDSTPKPLNRAPRDIWSVATFNKKETTIIAGQKQAKSWPGYR
jgi:hypothetical protein